MLSKIQMPVEFAYGVFTYGVQNTKACGGPWSVRGFFPL